MIIFQIVLIECILQLDIAHTYVLGSISISNSIQLFAKKKHHGSLKCSWIARKFNDS